jgi:uncharacterized protein (TIGR03435 family)
MIRPVLGLAALCCQVAIGQGADTRREFEVASVKPAARGQNSERRGGPGTNEPGQITYVNTWLPALVAEAYGVRSDQISGPDWMQTEVYSIVAKIPPNTTKQEFNTMLRNLLADRFHLTLHHEPKSLSVYVLSAAPGGTKLKLSPANVNEPFAPPASGSGGESRFPALAPGRTEAHLWRDRAYYTYRQTVPEFALGLGALVNMSNGDGIVRGSPPTPFIVDETGLEGRFDFTLEFAGSPMPSPALAVALTAQGELPSEAANPASTPVGGPSIFRALEQQLGLHLEKSKRTIDFLMIDHADRVPTEN